MKKLYLLVGILIGGILVIIYFIIFPVQSDNNNSNTASDSTNSTAQTNNNTNSEQAIPESGPIYEAARARDVKRLADVRAYFAALSTYYGDNGNYPSTLDELVPDYLSGILTNPTPGGMNYEYTPIGVEPAKFYSLYYKFEVGTENIPAGEHEATPQSYYTQ